MGPHGAVNYFDGSSWRIFRRNEIINVMGFNDGPPFFDKDGDLKMDIDNQTWEYPKRPRTMGPVPGGGWRIVAFDPGPLQREAWFRPRPPGLTPVVCRFKENSSFSRDRLGRYWWTWRGNLYEGVAGSCKLVLAANEAQPFIDGRKLRRVLVDAQGNVFLETPMIQGEKAEYVFLPKADVIPSREVGGSARGGALSPIGRGHISPAPPQQVQAHPTPQKSAELDHLLADASEAVSQISDWGIQQGDLMDLVGLYFGLGEKTRAHAIVQIIRNKYQALSAAIASGQNPPAGTYPGTSSVMELSTVASELAQFGDPADVLDIMKQIGYGDQTADMLSALQMIATRQAQAGDPQAALQTAARIRVSGWRDNALGEIAGSELEKHNIADALAAAARMTPSPERVHRLIAIAHAELLAGDRQAAVGTVAEAQEVAIHLPEQPPPSPQNFGESYVCSSGPNRSPSDQALPYLAQGQWDLGEHSAAMATRSEIQSSSLKEQALYNLVKVDAEENRFAEADQLAGEISASACRNQALGVLASAQIAEGDLQGGLARASEIQPASSIPWIDLALKAKDVATAKALFSRARVAAAKAPTELDRAEGLYGVAAFESDEPGLHQLYCADSAEAIRLAREVHAKGEHPPPDVLGFVSNTGVYEEVITFANCGKLAQAKSLALTQKGSQREDEIESIATIEVENGDLEGAEEWAQSLASPSDRASALIGIAITVAHNL